MPTKTVNFFRDTPIDRQAERRRMLAQQLRQMAVPRGNPFPNQGRITPKYTIGHGLTQLGAGLLARYNENKADEAEGQVVDRKRLALAEALGQPQTQELQLNDVEGGEPFRKTLQPMLTQEQQQIQGLINTMDPRQLDAASMARFQQLAGQSPAPSPSNVREWQFYSQLPPEEQAKYLEMKRALQITDVQGAPNIVRGGGVTTPLSSPEAETQAAAERAGAIAEAQAGVTPAGDRADAEAKIPRLQAAERRLDRVSSAVDALSDNRLLTGGPMQGVALAFTKEGQELQQANSQLLAELTALTRIPGVGSQSDLEQRLQQLVLPSPNMYPEINQRAVEELNLFLRDLGGALRSVGDVPPQLPEPSSGVPSGVDPEDWKYMTPEERALWK